MVFQFGISILVFEMKLQEKNCVIRNISEFVHHAKRTKLSYQVVQTRGVVHPNYMG